MATITAERIAPADEGAWQALGQRWRAVEELARATFFTSWTWVGCLAGERYDDPFLVAAVEGGETLALALFNRRRRPFRRARLWLHESGHAALDSPYVEHNGVLARDPDLAACCLKAALRHGNLVLDGVDEPTLLAARAAGHAWRREEPRPAPFLDLALVREAGGVAALLSANARQQMRRSRRALEAQGPLSLTRAADPGQALGFLREMAALHQLSWQARGKKGAFSQSFFMRYHEALLARALPRGEAELLRVQRGEQVLGILYNFVHRGRVLAYQSGFADASVGPSIGQVCHWLAIENHAAAGRDVYDFLAGESRYKTRFASDETLMHWIDLER